MENGKHSCTACCALCAAAAIGIAVSPSASASPDGGGLGASSTASLQIRVSVAPRGELSGLSGFSADSKLASSDPLCLWLNTGTRGYVLKAEAEGAKTHLLSWSAGGSSATLGPAASATFQAADRPRCGPDEQAQLAVRRIETSAEASRVTLLVAPE
jgi:hypothetical protein